MPNTEPSPQPSCRSAWARLIAKVYEIDPLVCPHCSSRMRVLADITDPAEVNKILRHLVKIGRPPLERQRCAKRAAGASRPGSRVAELTLFGHLDSSAVGTGLRSEIKGILTFWRMWRNIDFTITRRPYRCRDDRAQGSPSQQMLYWQDASYGLSLD